MIRFDIFSLELLTKKKEKGIIFKKKETKSNVSSILLMFRYKEF